MADADDSPRDEAHQNKSHHEQQQQAQLSLSPGLEFLIPTQGLIIQQQIEWGEILLGVHFNNKYHIVDDLGRRLFLAAENSDMANLVCMGKCRPWNIIVFNMYGHPVMSGSRTSSCCGGGACDNEVVVTSTTGLVLGRLLQNSSGATATWNILDSEGNAILLMTSPECSTCCPGAATCYEAEFPVKTLQGDQTIGRVTKQFSGMMRELMTQADTFCVQYPADLHVNIKAVLIFAAFMIDFIFYENVEGRGGGHHHHHRHY